VEKGEYLYGLGVERWEYSGAACSAGHRYVIKKGAKKPPFLLLLIFLSTLRPPEPGLLPLRLFLLP
jgi:hypothetical protein